ncbi:MAG: ABC transporter permease [Anaerolineae bacterium]|nr:ABC transporter permease [Anaerolineae bacterium]
MFLRTVWAILWKDLVTEWRNRQTFSAMLVFALVVIFLFNFALELNRGAQAVVTSGVIWVTFAFCGTLGFNRSLSAEQDRGCLDGLLLAPVNRAAIYVGKALSNLVFMLATAVVVLPVYSLLYNTNLFIPAFLLVVLLGMLGYAALGTMLSGMSMRSRMRDLLLPVLLFPVALPLLVAVVKASSGLLEGQPLSAVRHWMDLLVVYDIIFVTVSLLVFDEVIED